MQQKRSFGENMAGWLRYILACCDESLRPGEANPPLQISGPTNFRREDVSIPGLTAEQQDFIREKAKADAEKMWSNMTHVHPLRSSPSGNLASATGNLHTYHGFTSNPATSPTDRRKSGGWDRVKAHSRKISNSLTKPLGYHSPAVGEARGTDRGDSNYEMRALMDPVIAGKLSGESFSGDGSDGEERGSAKGISEAREH